MMTPDLNAVNELFYSFHSEFEAIVMDMVGDKIDQRTLDAVFSSFDELQEEYHNKLNELHGKEVVIMAKSIITQNGSVINYSNLLAIYVDENIDDHDRIIGYDLVGVTGSEKDSQALILGSYADEQTAENAKAELIAWLSTEAYSMFTMPDGGLSEQYEGGDGI